MHVCQTVCNNLHTKEVEFPADVHSKLLDLGLHVHDTNLVTFTHYCRDYTNYPH